MNKYSPVLLFVFARPDHTKRTIDALAANTIAKYCDLIVYADAARNAGEAKRVDMVRSLVKSVVGFRSITIIERESNYGLAKNIIEGVTDVCQRFGRAIVLEDDLITSPYFLSFMNTALDRYESDKRVWHVSGWNYPIIPDGLGDAFFLRVMNCWGWATWDDRWQCYEKNTDKLIAEFDRGMIKDFDLNNSGVFWNQVLQNKQNKISTWAIYWYATLFKRGGLCINPSVTFVQNIGHDGSGTHGSTAGGSYTSPMCMKSDVSLPSDIVENKVGIDRIKKYYKSLKPTLLSRVRNKFNAMRDRYL